MMLPTLEEIEAAGTLIRPLIPETPACTWPLLNEAAGCEVWVKHENHTPVGAFKVRGGLVYLDELLKQQPRVPGVIAASTGNHGQSIAFAAKRRGVRAVIVVPHGNNPEKNRAMRGLGAQLVEHGREFQEALEHSRELARREGLHPVPSFHPWLVRGVATYALEFFRAAPALDVVFVPIGLGSGACGIIAAGIALGLKTKFIGVVSSHAPAYALSFRQRRFITQPSATRVAEGVACSTPNELALECLMQHLDNVITVSDEDALAAMREMHAATQEVAEGAGALAWAAIRKQRDSLAGLRVGCVLSGGNASKALMAEALSGN
jgi:threonine dehydratase